jgi:dihydrofolate synthase/folylpolyglutamate synthase
MSNPAVTELDAAGVFAALLARMGEASPEPRLTATRRALELLGDPQKQFPFIHVTGTNGKTSTSRMAAGLLRHHGLHVGLFTSPHLTRFAERIALDGIPVSDETLASVWRRVDPTLRRVDTELTDAGQPPLTFFEALTVLAYQVFADSGVDAAVIEVGMGGEWDSTNVADGRVAVLTPISLDHTRQLGRSVGDIARTKSGIIKPGAIVVTALQPDDALAAIVTHAASVGSRVLVAERDFGGEPLSRTEDGQEITLRRIAGGVLARTKLSLHGDHQASNAALAVAAVEAFLGAKPLAEITIRATLSTVSSPGRLQIIDRDPLVLLDAAHNPAGALSLASAIRDWPGISEVAFVLGVLEEKDAVGIIDALRPVASCFFVTQSDSPRAIGHGYLSQLVAENSGIAVHDFSDPVAAVTAARAWAGARAQGAVVVTGSITLIGDALRRSRLLDAAEPRSGKQVDSWS